jgi:urea transporter
VLRGCSQCCFQTNEITGVLFLVAVLTYAWQQSLLMLIGAVVGTGVGMALKAERPLLELGLYGFNSCLMALALGNFFERDALLWVTAVLLCTITTVVARVMIRLLKFPVLAAPFILTFWVYWPLSEHLGATKLQFPPFIDTHVFWLRAGFAALGAALFAGTALAGLIFFLAVAVSSWRHAVLALVAAFTAHTVAVWWNVPGEQINAGLAGFNAVLAAVAIYALVQPDLRLALLGAVVASAVLPLFTKLGLVSLAAGFVLTVWVVIFLGWFQARYFNEKPAPAEP